MPTTRTEAWRWTNLQPLAQMGFEPEIPSATNIDLSAFGRRDGLLLAFVDGRFSARHSSLRGTPGVTVQSLDDALRSPTPRLQGLFNQVAAEHPFVSLNSAYLTSGAVLELDDGVQLADLVELLFVHTQASAVHPRVLIHLGKGASATVVETYASLVGGRTLTNAVTEVVLDEGARLSHCKLQLEAADGFHVGTLWAKQAATSELSSHVFSAGSKLARSEVSSQLLGEGARCNLFGLYVGKDEQHLDHRTTLDHRSPGCTSREVYKGLLSEKARGVFTGAVHVAQGAQRTDASQSNKALLLSEDASAQSTPQLQIYADDVKCAHGAAVGQLDEQALFYLRSRGIPLATAHELLTTAFADEVIHSAPATVQPRLAAALADKMRGGRP
jgi:Fe-S cluster assembly protein SufD